MGRGKKLDHCPKYITPLLQFCFYDVFPIDIFVGCVQALDVPGEHHVPLVEEHRHQQVPELEVGPKDLKTINQYLFLKLNRLRLANSRHIPKFLVSFESNSYEHGKYVRINIQVC